MSYNLRLLSVINVFNVVPFKLTFLVFDSILFSSDSLLLFATFCCYYYSPHVLPPPHLFHDLCGNRSRSSVTRTNTLLASPLGWINR